jgi:competence protein ComEA
MTLLSWIKSRNRTSPLILSQINGLTVILLVGIMVYFVAASIYWNDPWKWTVPSASRQEGTVIVELAGEMKQRGIYYLPSGATLSSLFSHAGISLPGDYPAHLANRKLSSGMAVIIDKSHRIDLGEMAAAKRLALDLPIDINRAALDDLLLIPGVKDATAEKILALRQASGGRIGRMEDLMQINGIKEKRLQHLKQYLYVEGSR